MGKFIASTPDREYIAVIFSSVRTKFDKGYEFTAEKMVELASAQPGYIGMESVRDVDGNGITVSYWENEESVRKWKQHVVHMEAQERGKSSWYRSYKVRVARVGREYGKNDS